MTRKLPDRVQRITFAVDAVADTFTAAAGPLRRLSGLVVPWDVETTRYGVPVVFTAATTRLPDRLDTVKLLVQHDDERPVGYAVDATYADDGLRMIFDVDGSHPRAAALLDDVDANLRDGFSVGIELDDDTFEAIIDRMFADDDAAAAVPFAGTIREVSAVSIPQFNGARVDNARELERFAISERETVMTDSLTPAAPPAAPPALSLEELAAQLAPLMGTASSSAHPLARFASFADYMLEARAGDVSRARDTLALVDQITENNPGVLPPTWLSTILGIIDLGRPAVSAFGGPGSAGDSGMEIDWPYYDGGYANLVGKQEAEKTEVTTRRVDIKRGSVELDTYAGASDISYQLLRRSSPSYREAYGRILAIAYGVTTDYVFANALATAAGANTGNNVSWDGSTIESFTAALFAASSNVDDAAGVPASVVLAAPDVFATVGTLAGVVPAPYGTRNVPGTADAGSLRVNISGLEITKVRSLPPGITVASTPEAAKWIEDGPFPIEADDVPKLGRDVGIWGMGASRISNVDAVVGIAIDGGAAAVAAPAKKS